MKQGVNRLYQDLAWLWPLWEDVEEYRQASELLAKLIKQHAKIEVQSLLDMGCGGGKNAFHFKRYFEVTGIDTSKAMLSLAEKLNPECNFFLGDMRNCNLNCQFDSVFINDSINYMTSKEDLRQVFQTAYKHLRGGGVMTCFVEVSKESFRQNKTTTTPAKSIAKPDNMDIVFIENYYDPNPEDDTYEGTLIYLIRENGQLRIEHDFHVLGLFTLDVWRESLRKARFEVHEEAQSVGSHDLPVFMCVKPL